jgi:hypothetical protein
MDTGGVPLISGFNLVLPEEVRFGVWFDRNNLANVFRFDLRGDLLVVRLFRTRSEPFDVGLTGLRTDFHT